MDHIIGSGECGPEGGKRVIVHYANHLNRLSVKIHINNLTYITDSAIAMRIMRLRRIRVKRGICRGGRI